MLIILKSIENYKLIRCLFVIKLLYLKINHNVKRVQNTLKKITVESSEVINTVHVNKTLKFRRVNSSLISSSSMIYISLIKMYPLCICVLVYIQAISIYPIILIYIISNLGLYVHLVYLLDHPHLLYMLGHTLIISF